MTHAVGVTAPNTTLRDFVSLTKPRIISLLLVTTIAPMYVAGTPNCRSNFEQTLRPFGIPLQEIPYSFNVFMNAPIEPDGKMSIHEPISKPGDHVDLRAETDLIVAISNCPQERNPCNAFKPTRLRVIVHGASA